MTRQQLIDNALAELEKFKCIQSDCDGAGNIPYQVEEGVWEADQCEFHAKYLFPIKALFTTHLNLMADSVIEGEEKI